MSEWVRPERLPRHVAIVMDGNGRWAKRRLLPRAMGHRRGMEAIRGVVRESGRLGIESLTLYAFSTENWKRSTDEVGVLMGLLLEYLNKEVRELNEENVRIRFLGRLDGIPAQQREAMARAVETTKANTGLTLNLAINYGGRDELARAARSLCRRVLDGSLSVDAIDEAAIAGALDTAGQPDVDLMIRTSGEQRLSNFLPFQSAYAEFLFPDTLWPDFTPEAYRTALSAFAARDRRFGGRGGKEE